MACHYDFQFKVELVGFQHPTLREKLSVPPERRGLCGQGPSAAYGFRCPGFGPIYYADSLGAGRHAEIQGIEY